MEDFINYIKQGCVPAMPKFKVYCFAFCKTLALKISFMAVLILLSAHSSSGMASSLTEQQIKTAYLYNLAKFVEWPEQALAKNQEMQLCVLGNEVLNGALDALDGRKSGEHYLRVIHRNFADPDLAACHILYIGNSEQQRFLVTLKALQHSPVLTVSDIENFAEKGGGIGLVLRDNKVVFEVNLEPIRNAGLHIPGQLLNIASYVYGR